jgi:hypothetical protein
MMMRMLVPLLIAGSMVSVAANDGSRVDTGLRVAPDRLDRDIAKLEGHTGPSFAVTVSSTAFLNAPNAGDRVAFSASASGASQPATFSWDVDGDGIFERSGSNNRIEVSYARITSTEITVRVTDADGVVSSATRALEIRGPILVAEPAGAPVQLCGNGDAILDPGERWQLPIRLSNIGDADFLGGHALFAATSNALRLPQAAQPVAGIAVDAEVTIELPLAIDPAASCGDPLAFDFIAGVDGRAHWFDRTGMLQATIGSTCQPVSGCDLFGDVSDASNGMYFDPARATNGLQAVLLPVAPGRHVYGGLWCTGELDHTPTWFLLSGELYAYAGEVHLLRFTRLPGESFGVEHEIAGRAWVAFTAGEDQLVAWEIDAQGHGVERMVRLAHRTAQPNHTSLWYNPAESGWGLGIDSIDTGDAGDFEFIAAYLYDHSGAPRWLVAGLPSLGGGVFEFLAYQPHCPGCPRYTDVGERMVDAGSMLLEYSSATSARISTDLVLPEPWSGNWLRSDLPLQPIVIPASGSEDRQGL